MIPGESVRCWQPTTLTLAGQARGCVLLALALAAGPVQAACPSSFQDVLDGTERALVAFEEGRFDDFAEEEGGLGSDLDCLDGVLEPMESSGVLQQAATEGDYFLQAILVVGGEPSSSAVFCSRW